MGNFSLPGTETNLSLTSALIALLLSALFGYLITLTYRYATNSTSGGRQVASTLLPLAITVCVIISVVKTSLALSLGLVGALSIVRFRTPIKDPEDLVYIFLAIVAGLGFGATQISYTAISISILCLILVTRSKKRGTVMKSFDQSSDVNIMINWPCDANISMESLINEMSASCSRISLLRYNSERQMNSLFVQANLIDGKDINQIVESLSKKGENLTFSVNNSNIDW